MDIIRKSAERGHANHGWLDSYHSFSFADYYDPAHTQFGALRVINEDVVDAGQGFGMHGHRDMEIVTYMLAGALEHKDSMGNGSVIRQGDVQRMSAGTGVRHSEFNPSSTEAAHLLQIWIIPEKSGTAPSYEEKNFVTADKRGKFCLIASGRAGDHHAVHVGQDVRLYAGLFDAGERAVLTLDGQRRCYAHLARGKLTINGHVLAAGDALLLDGSQSVTCENGSGAEVLVFDLAA
jgi:redox-sensitive bicupin YhaK (pirin superfamily)